MEEYDILESEEDQDDPEEFGDDEIEEARKNAEVIASCDGIEEVRERCLKLL